MRKTVVKILAALLSCIFVFSMLAACKVGEKSGAGTTAGTTSGQTTTTKATEATTTTVAKIDPLGKYEPAIEITTFMVDDGAKFKDGEDFNNNIWVRTLESDLGIKLKFLWTAPDAQVYEQKLNIAITSNDIPDFIPVYNLAQLQRLYEADLIVDLTQAYEKYKSSLLDDIMKEAGPIPIKAVTYNGKMMAIPTPPSAYDFLYLYLRKDWLDKLGLKEPKTVDDLVNIAEMFANNDPNGNNAKDTIGFGLTQNIYAGKYNASGFFNSFGASPTSWVKDSSGKVVFGGVQPEIKAALETLQKMYKEGLIDEEFGVADDKKVEELCCAEKCGMVQGVFYVPLALFRDTLTNNPQAQWRCYPIVSATGTPAKVESKISVSSAVCVNKKSKYPEVPVKIMNYFANLYYNAPKDVQERLLTTPDGWQVFKYLPLCFRVSRSIGNLYHQRLIKEALNKSDTSKLPALTLTHYQRVTDYFQKGDITKAGYAYIFGPEGSTMDLSEYYIQNKLYFYDEWYGATTPTMAERWATLQKMQIEAYTRIIMGEDPVSAFDTFVSNWMNAGGEQITKEVNDVLKK